MSTEDSTDSTKDGRDEERLRLRKEYVIGLRELADFIESLNITEAEHGEVPAMTGFWFGHKLQGFVYSKEDIAVWARAMGSFNKNFDGNYFELVKKFSENVSMEVNIGRDNICERVVIGTKIVPETYIPSKFVAEHEEEIVEWRCPEDLAILRKITQ